MANPQTENGHIRIANDLFQAIHSAGLSGREHDVLAAIIRYTWGYGNKENEVSCETIAEFIGIKDSRNISRITKRLCARRIIIKVARWGETTVFKVNKDYETWTPLNDTDNPESDVKSEGIVNSEGSIQNDVTVPSKMTGQYLPNGRDSTFQNDVYTCTKTSTKTNIKTSNNKGADAPITTTSTKVKYPLCKHYADLTVRYPTKKDNDIEEDIREHKGYREDVAIKAMDACYKSAHERNVKINGFAFFHDAIIEAIDKANYDPNAEFNQVQEYNLKLEKILAEREKKEEEERKQILAQRSGKKLLHFTEIMAQKRKAQEAEAAA